MTYEPPLDDPIALDKDDECDECGDTVGWCVHTASTPDRMYGDD